MDFTIKLIYSTLYDAVLFNEYCNDIKILYCPNTFFLEIAISTICIHICCLSPITQALLSFVLDSVVFKFPKFYLFIFIYFLKNPDEYNLLNQRRNLLKFILQYFKNHFYCNWYFTQIDKALLFGLYKCLCLPTTETLRNKPNQLFYRHTD